MGAESK